MNPALQIGLSIEPGQDVGIPGQTTNSSSVTAHIANHFLLSNVPELNQKKHFVLFSDENGFDRTTTMSQTKPSTSTE